MDKKLPLALLLLAAALPASADFCAYNSREESRFRDLAGPECRRESNNLVFAVSYPAYSKHMSKDGSTYVTNSYPGLMGDEQKCMDAAKGARIMADHDSNRATKESYLLAWAVSGTRVFRWKGSCSSLKDKFGPAVKEAAKGAEPGDDTVADALKAIGAEEIWTRTFVERLIDVGRDGYKPLD